MHIGRPLSVSFPALVLVKILRFIRANYLVLLSKKHEYFEFENSGLKTYREPFLHRMPLALIGVYSYWFSLASLGLNAWVKRVRE